MATPMSADGWLNALRVEGITKIVQMPGWKTHNRDDETGKTFGPVHGVAIHHTAGVGPGMAEFCRNGSAALPGPLVQDFLAKDGTLYLVGHGRCNHAGSVTPAVRDAILDDKAPTGHEREQGSESVDGNDFLYGLEIENRGDGKDPYPAVQYDIAVKWAAARLRYHGWTANSAWGHKELTTRKTDPSFPKGMSQFRKDVSAVLSKPAGYKAPTTSTAPRSIDAVELNGMTDYTSVSRTGVSSSIGNGLTYEVYFSGEQADDPGDHGLNGKTVLAGPGQFSGSVKLRFENPAPAGLTFRMVRQENNVTVGTEWMGDITPGADHFVAPVIGAIGSGQNLVLVIDNHSGGTVNLTEAFLRFHSQAA